MTPSELGTVIAFIVTGFVALQAITWIVRRWLKLDSSEREQVLQMQINDLNQKIKHQDEKIEDYEKEVEDLRRQVRIMVAQYEEAIGKLGRLQEAYDQSMETNRQLREQVNNLSSGYVMRDSRPEKILLVLVGSPDAGLSLDLATLRAVRTETGLEIQEITDPTPEKLKRALDRARMKQDHIYLHMAVKADKEGYLIGDTIVDAIWLSSILTNVIILVVAGTDSDNVGDFLGVVPYVVTMSGGISHRDASIFSRAFWTEIGKGIGPSMALRRALDRSPGTIREKVVSHWNS